MPSWNRQICRFPGCRRASQGRYCPSHLKQPRSAGRTPRSRASSAKRGYDRRWQVLRKWYLARHPLCESCLAVGKFVATFLEVDHVIPIAVRPDLRLAPSNLQTLCRRCHKRKTDHDARTQATFDGQGPG